MPVVPKYLEPVQGAIQPSSTLIQDFKVHFHKCVAVGGNEEDFLAEFRKFKKNYIDKSVGELYKYANCHPSQFDDVRKLAAGEVDQLLFMVLGMGQISIAFKLLPFPAATGAPREVVSDTVPVISSAKAKAREARRYTHVLSTLIAKNNKDPGAFYGIPEEAKGKVPGQERMIAEMVEAMQDESEVLDFADTKPFKDHWRQMKYPDFHGLAITLFYHMNQLHQGADYVEGFRYTDRYRNLISLLQKCKGTIYFMSRPSTYEDVLLNPHMMQLRFADNQKNNAKKKVDNRELTARRNSEYLAVHGCSPPPKERTYKKKRAASTINDTEEASSSASKPVAKKRKSSVKKDKAAAAFDDSRTETSIATPFDAGEGSSAQGEPAHNHEQYYPGQEQIYFDHEQQQHQPPYQQQLYYSPPQQPGFLPSQHNQQFFNPQQQQLFSQLQQQQQQQQSAPQGQQQQTRPKAKPRARRTQAAALNTPVIAAPLAPVNVNPTLDVESQIATTIADAVQNSNYLPDSYFHGISPNGYQQQQQAVSGYQTPATMYPGAVMPYDNIMPEHGQVTQFQDIPFLQSQYNQTGLEYQTPDWYSPQNYIQNPQAVLQPINQQSVNQQPHQQVQHQHQAHQFKMPTSGSTVQTPDDPYWGGDQLDEIDRFLHLNEGLPTVEEMAASMFEMNTPGPINEVLVNSPLETGSAGLQRTVTPTNHFDLKRSDLGNASETVTKDTSAGFADLPDLPDFVFDDLSPMGYLGIGMSLDSAANTGGQDVQMVLGGRSKMKEMDAMLALDP